MNNATEFEQCARRLKALADAERLKIVMALFGGPKNVGELVSELDDELVRVSHHLGVLRNAGLVQADKQGRFVVYSLHADVAAAVRAADDARNLDLGCCRLDLGEGKRRHS